MPKIIENVKEKILYEARKMILSGRSYKELNIRDIAKNANIGIGTFYNYFSNKEEVAVEVFKKDWEGVLLLINQLKYSDEPPKSKLRKIYLSLETFIDKYMVIFYEIAQAEGDEKRPQHVYHELYTCMEELLAQEEQKGHIHSDLQPNKLCVFLVSNFMYLAKKKYMSFDEFINNIKI